LTTAALSPAAEDEGASSSPSQYVEEEKKSPDATTLSLQERRQLQREKQLRFLRDQGLIRTEADLPGGAGADGASSVASGGASPAAMTTTTKPLRPFSIKNTIQRSTP
jgi:hypothetical protein